MPELVSVVKSDLAVVLNLTFRLVLLGGMIFLATTYIPKTELSLEIRLTISVVVVLIYSLLDALWKSLAAVKAKLCEWICGCSSGTISSPDLTL